MHFEEVYMQHETADRLSRITLRSIAPEEWLQLRFVVWLTDTDEVGAHDVREHTRDESQAPSPVTEGGPASHLSPNS